MTWSGAAENSYVLITVAAHGRYDYVFFCAAAAAEGEFTVPPFTLLGFPSSAVIQSPGVSNIAYQTFSAKGLDLGVATASVSVTAASSNP